MKGLLMMLELNIHMQRETKKTSVHAFYHIQKLTQPDHRSNSNIPKTIKLLKANIEQNLCNLGKDYMAKIFYI